MAKKIEHITQPNGHTCVHTCLAMVAGISVEKTLDYLPDEAAYMKDFVQALKDLGVSHTVKRADNQLEIGKCYVVAVPSLNRKRGMHMMVVDCRWGEATVFDSCRGKPDLETYARDGSDLESWADTIHVVPTNSSRAHNVQKEG